MVGILKYVNLAQLFNGTPDLIELIAHITHFHVFSLSLRIHNSCIDIHRGCVRKFEENISLVVRQTDSRLKLKFHFIGSIPVQHGALSLAVHDQLLSQCS